MKKEYVKSAVLLVIGITSMAFGAAVAKREEKRLAEEIKALEKEREYLTARTSALGAAIEQYKSEVDEMSTLADSVLKYIEESENDLDEEEEL